LKITPKGGGGISGGGRFQLREEENPGLTEVLKRRLKESGELPAIQGVFIITEGTAV